jgi:hypothetical protein
VDANKERQLLACISRLPDNMPKVMLSHAATAKQGFEHLAYRSTWPTGAPGLQAYIRLYEYILAGWLYTPV